MNMCQICDKSKNAPYKCPTCRIKYCSVNCYKTHRSSDVPCETLTKKNEEKSQENPKPVDLGDHEETDRIPMEKLKMLDESTEVRNLLKNVHLRTMIKALDGSNDPADDMQKAMLEPIFVQFVDEILKVVEK